MPKKNKIIYFIISTIFFILFDMVMSNAVLQNTGVFSATSPVDLIYVKNTGAAFSILQNAKGFLIGFSIFAIAGIAIYAVKHAGKSSMFSLFWTAILLAGIFCNLYERITLGYVRDFFKLNFVDFPVFNISDIFINISVFAIVIIIIKHNFSKNNETGN